jgi:hypothetical protein
MAKSDDDQHGKLTGGAKEHEIVNEFVYMRLAGRLTHR